MPLIEIATCAPSQRLLQVAAGETCQSDTAVTFLPAGRNAKSCGGLALSDLWAVGDAIARDMVATPALITTHREYQSRAAVRAVVTLGRPALARTGDV